MPQNGSECGATNVLRHLDDIAERVLRRPAGAGAGHRAHDVVAVSGKMFEHEYFRHYKTDFFEATEWA